MVNSNLDLKICDFGLARPVIREARANICQVMDSNAARWFRAPEYLLDYKTHYLYYYNLWPLMANNPFRSYILIYSFSLSISSRFSRYFLPLNSTLCPTVHPLSTCRAVLPIPFRSWSCITPKAISICTKHNCCIFHISDCMCREKFIYS